MERDSELWSSERVYCNSTSHCVKRNSRVIIRHPSPTCRIHCEVFDRVSARAELRSHNDHRHYRLIEMGNIRHFVEEDIDSVADLHLRVFRHGQPMTADLRNAYRSYFLDVFLKNPWFDPRISSFVYCAASGNIAGFIGVVPRPIRIRQQRAMAAVSSQFIVDPQAGSAMAGIQLLRAFLKCGQDLSIADEANDVSRVLWERLGGSTAVPHSIEWTRPLRPTQLALRLLVRRKSVKPLAIVVSPLAKILDTFSARVARTRFRVQTPTLMAHDMDINAMLGCVSDMAERHALVPEHDRLSLEWTLGRLQKRQYPRQLRNVIVRDGQDRIVGWYVASVDRGGIAEVLQMSTKPQFAREVLDRLAYDMWRAGSIAVTGRFAPGFAGSLLGPYCYILRRQYWMLVHSARPEILEALHRGDATLSKLEGEFLLRFK